MTNKPICDGCTSLDDKGECGRSILPFRKSERVPECFSPIPESMAAKYFEGAMNGYGAVEAAIATMRSNGFADEQPLFLALNAGVGPHISDLSDENLHPLAGFLAGASNRIREALLQMSQPETHPTR